MDPTRGHYERPSTLDAALGMLGETGPDWTILAGGTDIFPIMTNEAAWSGPKSRNFLDISAIPDLLGIQEEPDGYRIGALVTWGELTRSKLPSVFDCLREAGREVGGTQIQNRGTLVGNVCNASPAADGIPALVTLGANLELSSIGGRRTIPVEEFVVGNRNTALAPNEIVTALTIPNHSPETRSTFLKLGTRRYLVISIAMVSVLIEPDEHDRIKRARIAVGACSASAQRLVDLEDLLAHVPANEDLTEFVRPSHLDALTPIDDVRATAAYRKRAAFELTRRALRRVAGKLTDDGS